MGARQPELRGPCMAAKDDGKTEIERLREVIRLLNRAIYDCNRLLMQAEASIEASGQDNEPRLKRPSA